MITMNADEDARIGTAEYNKGLQHTGITTETEKLHFLEDCNCDYYKEYRDFGVLQRVWRESMHCNGTDTEENESYREVSTLARIIYGLIYNNSHNRSLNRSANRKVSIEYVNHM